MDTTELIKELSVWTDPDSITKSIIRIKEILGEDITHVIPSILLQNDGPSLNSVYGVTESFLFELDMSTKADFNFDIVAKYDIVNIRIKEYTANIKSDGDVTEYSYKAMEVELLHKLTNFGSSLHYIGEKRDEWLNQVLEALPPTLLL